MNRGADFELQFKAYLTKDPKCQPNWPDTFELSVNQQPVAINRVQQPHRALNIKRLCDLGDNALDMTVSACCCVSRRAKKGSPITSGHLISLD